MSFSVEPGSLYSIGVSSGCGVYKSSRMVYVLVPVAMLVEVEVPFPFICNNLGLTVAGDAINEQSQVEIT